jgi:hypothetical protein
VPWGPSAIDANIRGSVAAGNPPLQPQQAQRDESVPHAHRETQDAEERHRPLDVRGRAVAAGEQVVEIGRVPKAEERREGERSHHGYAGALPELAHGSRATAPGITSTSSLRMW